MHRLSLKSNYLPRIQKGYPWVYRHTLCKPPQTPPGELVHLCDATGDPFAIAYYHPHTKLAARVLTYQPSAKIDESFFYQQFSQALAKRQRWFKENYYRLVHAEGDHLPGLIVDRFDEVLVCQTSTAGMENLKPLWLAALHSLLKPKQIILRDDVPTRLKEELPLTITALEGDLPEKILVQEMGVKFYASPGYGQKTGWFYDHRANRYWISQRAKGKTVLDLYTYMGGFGISSAVHGASHVLMVDSSATALEAAQNAAIFNHVESRCAYLQEKVFLLLPQLIEQQCLFDIVIVDPPAFVKQARDKGAGLRGYLKLAKLASQVVAKEGLLFIASCSHHASTNEFRQAVEKGIASSGRTASLLRKAGADKDHPINPFLQENHYLKSLTYKLD